MQKEFAEHTSDYRLNKANFGCFNLFFYKISRKTSYRKKVPMTEEAFIVIGAFYLELALFLSGIISEQ